ncbi:FAD binding domain-containing protein [Nocardia araoensis]|uniref:FAD binding domain-containing protein n=1 Tax=Nocardia araoensis TaxID=228600 RepID=UPI0002DA0B68|nr:FAD binding domain-containing protein [Nocardia araoensis]
MHPVDFGYSAPTTVAQACTELSGGSRCTRLLAGGMSIMPQIIRRLARPEHLVDITRIAALQQLTSTGEGLRVGAAVVQRRLEGSAELAGYDLLRQALPRIGSVSTRNRGTVVGSLAHADPGAQLGVCLVALGGELTAVSTAGARHIPVTDFFRGPYTTALRADELLTDVTFARPPLHTIGYFESVSLRGRGDTPLISVALLGRRRVDAVPRLVVGGAGRIPSPIPASILDDLSDKSIASASHTLQQVLRFDDDLRASADHRVRLTVRVLTRLLHRYREESR